MGKTTIRVYFKDYEGDTRDFIFRETSPRNFIEHAQEYGIDIDISHGIYHHYPPHRLIAFIVGE